MICHWDIWRGGNNRRIVVEIEDFDMERGFDYLEIRQRYGESSSGDITSRLTGQIKLRTIMTAIPRAWIRMRMFIDKAGTRKGFRLTIRQHDSSKGTHRPMIFRE